MANRPSLAIGGIVSVSHNTQTIRIGLVAGEPIRLEGLTMIFEEAPTPGKTHLVPIIGSIQELLGNPAVEYLVVDLNSSGGGFETVEAVRRTRPGMRQIVIGPDNEDELVLSSIIAGARAYLDSSAGPDTIRQAIEIVVSGSIWAPRRLLSKLIDRLLNVPDTSLPSEALHLTARERQVLELILTARSNREIANELGIEERTVKAHVGRLMRKAGAENRIELSMRALAGALSPESAAKSKES